MPIPLETPVPIAPNQPVAATTDNTALGARDRNIKLIADRVDALGPGSRNVLVDVPLGPGCSRLTPVRYDGTIGKFIPAKYGTTGDGTRLDPAAAVCGVVDVVNGPVGTVIVGGMCAATDAELANVSVGAAHAGLYYLSDVSGKYTAAPTAVPIVVLARGPGDTVIVMPSPAPAAVNPGFLRFDLVAEPAGVHSDPGSGNPHVITSPNAALPGWLPANHASFAGKTVPAGADFGYNLAAHPALAAVWPPSPVSAAWVEYDLGQGGTGAGAGFVVTNASGIWWMTAYRAKVPWLYTLVTNGTTRPTIPAPATSPPESAVRVTLWMSRPTGGAYPGVTDIYGDNGILVRSSLDESPAHDGSLVIYAQRDPATYRGAVAVRDFSGDGFALGPVVEAIRGVGVTVTGTGPTVLSNPNDDGSPLAATGVITLVVAPPGGFVIKPSKVWLDGPADQDYDGLIYLGFPAGRATKYTARFDIPAGLAGTVTGVLRLAAFGRLAASVPILTIRRKVVTKPTGTSASPGAWVSGPAPSAASWASANHVVTVLTASFGLTTGTSVFVEVSRGATDGYNSPVGIVDQELALTIAP